MRAMILERPGFPLRPVELPLPEPGAVQVRVRVAACGVCRTDLHVVDGDLTEPKLPIIPGMTAEVDILTGNKSVLSYLLKPVLKAQAYALRER